MEDRREHHVEENTVTECQLRSAFFHSRKKGFQVAFQGQGGSCLHVGRCNHLGFWKGKAPFYLEIEESRQEKLLQL